MASSAYVAYYESPLGWMELGSSAEALQVVRFVPEKGRQVFTSLLGETQQQLTEYFSGKRRDFDLPLQWTGTAFQQTVWQRLRELPYAETVSYINLAREIGDEKATRAVAAANAKNQIALIVPCHRVIGTDGKPVGYAWEIWRKRWLLQHEQQHSGTGQLWLF
ncbi:methylated-DNA--[protein]-cysteine S-methyltransferase [Siphonobacter sp.]|uniref:methylated-DNA--[protein]-cysteine S-methyltransferase n=1 Tax=Siphonobacter sp. TaxID=1869184 RepID=UPI003B3B6160